MIVMDCDPVTVTEIAERMGVVKGTVHEWRRRHEDFPEPAGFLAGMRWWHWQDIQDWHDRRPRWR